tara:strand:- start:62 stop:433 length:372 start_codon:yes stop_codon:yes gene_type:complete
MPGILFQNLSKTFADGTQALQGFDLEVKDGELLALVGPSGCGKTTLLRILAGLEVPTTGQVFLDDRDITDSEPKDRDLGMVFQNYASSPTFPYLKTWPLALRPAVTPPPRPEPLLNRLPKGWD